MVDGQPVCATKDHGPLRETMDGEGRVLVATPGCRLRKPWKGTAACRGARRTAAAAARPGSGQASSLCQVDLTTVGWRVYSLDRNLVAAGALA